MPDSFVPSPATARAYRDALSCFGTGITVVTTQTDDGPVGMTANSFASVSLDPPLVLWSPAKSSWRHDKFVAAKHFAVHILGVEQKDLAQAFAKDPFAFDQCVWAPSDNGTPLIENCLSNFECRTEAVHDAGDHSIIVGRVILAYHREGTGLMFKQGKFGRFEPNDETS